MTHVLILQKKKINKKQPLFFHETVLLVPESVVMSVIRTIGQRGLLRTKASKKSRKYFGWLSNEVDQDSRHFKRIKEICWTQRSEKFGELPIATMQRVRNQ